ncbi:MAG: hypothetical protein HY912_14440 [Desulfomonile tiedjei]|uniref:Uncharacterized protein n=1 Tax=Desulfomonile tiedjei TaxID=2358 RepID=A0A9D6V246_9BACT|nr:hypothetical protein [Desulfomonile tiedjei]
MSDPPESQFEKAFPFLISGAFLVLGCVGILNHEMWRDELQPWLIAKDGADLSAVLQTIKNEGHPGLWYALLYFLSKLTSNPIGSQLLHLAIAATSVYVVAAFAPFSRLQKALFALGYFPLYEYSIISRNYAIGILFMFVLCAMYPVRRSKYVGIGIILALMANCNAFSAIIAIALFGVLVLDFISQTASERGQASKAAVGSLVFFLGLMVAIDQMIPRQESCYSNNWYFLFNYSQLRAVLSTIAASYLPIPDMKTVAFWNYNLLAVSRPTGWLMPYISVVLFIGCAVSLYRTPLALCLYLYSSFGVMLFTYLVHFGALRHHGHLFIILVMCYWIAACHENSTKVDPGASVVFWGQRTRNVILTSLLCLHLIAGLFAFTTDLRHPFSAAREVAEFIKGLGKEEAVVLGDGPYINSVGAYLNKEVYSADRRRFGTYVVYDREYSTPPCRKLLEEAKQIGQTRHTDVILVLNHDIPCMVPDEKIELLMKVKDTIVADERAYVYMLKQGP